MSEFIKLICGHLPTMVEIEKDPGLYEGAIACATQLMPELRPDTYCRVRNIQETLRVMDQVFNGMDPETQQLLLNQRVTLAFWRANYLEQAAKTPKIRTAEPFKTALTAAEITREQAAEANQQPPPLAMTDLRGGDKITTLGRLVSPRPVGVIARILGGKGVHATIMADKNMPVAADGPTAEIIPSMEQICKRCNKEIKKHCRMPFCPDGLRTFPTTLEERPEFTQGYSHTREVFALVDNNVRREIVRGYFSHIGIENSVIFIALGGRYAPDDLKWWCEVDELTRFILADLIERDRD